jgi:hypothetical protein
VKHLPADLLDSAYECPIHSELLPLHIDVLPFRLFNFSRGKNYSFRFVIELKKFLNCRLVSGISQT